MQKFSRFSAWLGAALSSRKFFVGLLIFFVFESVWIAVSARFPMAFDEDFHFGIIKLYAGNHFSPFFAAQPAGADTFGAVARDPSYLYHYLMSFPYRLISLLTDSQMVQVVALRLLNVALVAGGLVATRRLLLRAKMSSAVTNCALAIFALIPIVPQLAGQINYDNLLILTVPLTLLATLSVVHGLAARKVYVGQLVLLVSALALESVIKYPFLPIALAIAVFVLYKLLRAFWGKWADFRKVVAVNYRKLSGKAVAGLLILLVVSLGLFAQRYVVNVVKYHDPLPDCAAVLDENRCQAYSPWARNHLYKSQKTDVDTNIFAYGNLWFHDMLLRSVFAINGPFSEFHNDFPLWTPQAVAEFCCLLGVILLAVFARKMFRGRIDLQLLGWVAAVYVVVLFLDNYKSYIHTGQPVAINGRYLLLVMPLILALVGLAYVRFLRAIRLERLRPVLAAAVVLLLLQGGGFVTWILQSNESWYWENSQPVAAMNNAARTILGPVVFEKPAERFLKYE